MYIGIIAPTLERKHSPTKQRFELYHHVNTLIYLRLFTDQSSPRHHVSTSQQRAEAVNGASMYMSMCNGQLLNFFILICGHIKKISHHYCVNIWTHIEKKVLTLELSSESTLKNH